MSSTEQYHVVTAVEPAWVQQKRVPDDDGNPRPAEEPTVEGPVDSLFQEAEYTCSCGEELDGWHDVEEHFDAVTRSAEQPAGD